MEAIWQTTPAMSKLGLISLISPYGTSRVSNEPSSMFSDVFDGSTIDASKWTAAGTNTPTQSNGTVTLSLTANTSLTSTFISVPRFASALNFNVLGCVLTLDSAPIANPNVHRFFGFGQVTSYAPSTPVTDGVGYEVDLTGAFNCVIYSGGTRYVLNSSNPALITSSAGGGGTALPTGGTGGPMASIGFPVNNSRVALIVREDIVYWYLNGLDAPIAYASLVNRNVSGLPIRAASITQTSGTVSATTFTLSALAVGDSAGQGITMVASSIPSNAPANSTSTAYEASRLAKPLPGTLYGVTGYNSNASARFIQIFDSATLPADATAPAVLISVPGTTSFTIDFGVYGRRFVNGIVMCNSTTGPTKTIGTADTWFDVRFV